MAQAATAGAPANWQELIADQREKAQNNLRKLMAAVKEKKEVDDGGRSRSR